MEKTLNFTDNGKEYTLAFTRDSVIATENMGFNLAEAMKRPVFSITVLWRGAFLAHHDSLTIAEIDELFERVDKEGLLTTLIDLYKAPIESLFDEGNSKNAIKWTVT